VLTGVLTVAVLAFVGVRLAGAARFATGEGRERALLIVRGIGWRHLWPVPFVLTAVLIAAAVLVSVPGLSWGWWTALGGTGNPVTGGTDQTAGSPLEWLIPLVFLSLLLPAIPLFAWREEEIFRKGAEAWTWPRRAWMAVKFGLAHALIGIPIGIALALSIGGAYFQSVYVRAYHRTYDQRDAVMESTRAHTAYNAVIVTVVAVAVVLLAAGVG